MIDFNQTLTCLGRFLGHREEYALRYPPRSWTTKSAPVLRAASRSAPSAGTTTCLPSAHSGADSRLPRVQGPAADDAGAREAFLVGDCPRTADDAPLHAPSGRVMVDTRLNLAARWRRKGCAGSEKYGPLESGHATDWAASIRLLRWPKLARACLSQPVPLPVVCSQTLGRPERHGTSGD